MKVEVAVDVTAAGQVTCSVSCGSQHAVLTLTSEGVALAVDEPREGDGG